HASHRHPHSFPTRRSSDLALEATCAPEREPFAQIDTLVTKSARRASSKIDDGSTFFVRHVPRAAGMVTTRRMKTLVLGGTRFLRSEEHTSELQSLAYLVCR